MQIAGLVRECCLLSPVLKRGALRDASDRLSFIYVDDVGLFIGRMIRQALRREAGEVLYIQMKCHSKKGQSIVVVWASTLSV